MKNLIYKLSGTVAGLALMATALNVNSACYYFIHQPELPQGAEKLSKIK